MTGLKAWLRETKQSLLHAPGLMFALDRALFALLRKGSGSGRYSLLLAPPGGGNIGDQAMVESFLENTEGPIRLLVRHAHEVSVPAAHQQRTEVIALRSLVYGGLPLRLLDSIRYQRLLRDAHSLAVIGADIMDGAYNWRASVNRSNLAWLASRQGVDTRILGFSWNGNADHRALEAIRRAAAAGVRLLLRDPVSAARIRADHVSRVSETADTVFAARSVDHKAAEQLLQALPAGSAFALINASGLVEQKTPQQEEYRTLIDGLLQRGLQVILLPHVSRPGADDMIACRNIQQACNDPRVHLVERLLQPAEIRGLTARARLVVTGRMHLSIMSLYNSVPAITLASQGKVEGLMQLFGLEALCIEPRPGFGQKALAQACTVLDQLDALRSRIDDRLPEVRERAQLNFVLKPSGQEKHSQAPIAQVSVQ